LTPYDILTLRKRLDMTAPDFLLQYTVPTYLEKTDLPGVQIKLNEDDMRCPFLISSTEGCRVYTDRPTTCRYYPVGMANFHEGAQEEQTAEEFYFIVKEPHCKGFEEEKTWTIREWRENQGVDIRDQMNKAWMEIVMRRKSFGYQATLSDQAKRMFFMASTDLDQFRQFVLESSFLDTYEVDEETLDKIKSDDVELMHFAVRYLTSSLFGTEYLKIKPEKIRAKIEEVQRNQEEIGKSVEERAEAELAALKAERERMRKARG
jgi:Fe-S-cluster containining protein